MPLLQRMSYFCLGLVCVTAMTANAAEITQSQSTQLAASRYSLVQLGPTIAQSDLLSAIVQLHFSSRVKTVGDAMQLVLHGSGYHLALTKISNPLLQQLLAYPLPAVQRHLGPMTVRDALQTLAGSAYTLIVDPVNREVSFKLAIPAPTITTSTTI